MKNYVVIIKTMGELTAEEKIGHKYIYPDNWPARCEEVCSLKECTEKFPGRQIFTIEGYKLFKAGVNLAEESLPLVNPPQLPAPSKPWWKFWGN